MVMITGSMICKVGVCKKCQYWSPCVKYGCANSQNKSVDVNVPLVGRVDGRPGQHTEESLSPLERQVCLKNLIRRGSFN